MNEIVIITLDPETQQVLQESASLAPKDWDAHDDLMEIIRNKIEEYDYGV